MASIVTIGGGTTGCTLKTAATTVDPLTSGTAYGEITSLRLNWNMGERDVTHLSSGIRRDFIPTLFDYTMDVEGHLLPDKINLTAQPTLTNAQAGTIWAFGVTFNDPTSAATMKWEGFITSFNMNIPAPDQELTFAMTIRGTTAITLANFATT